MRGRVSLSQVIEYLAKEKDRKNLEELVIK
jgi:predicted CopG family antitoxin